MWLNSSLIRPISRPVLPSCRVIQLAFPRPVLPRSELNDVRQEAQQHADQLRIQIAGLASKIDTEVAGLKSQITGLESKIQSEIAGLKVEVVQGLEEDSRRLTRNVFGIAVIVSAVVALVQVLL